MLKNEGGGSAAVLLFLFFVLFLSAKRLEEWANVVV
jgi:hypothetical protein